MRTFRNSCQLFLPARNRRPSWFSPLNQILRGERRGGGTPKTSPVLSFPLWRQKDVIILTKPSVISGTRGFPCRLHTSFPRSHRPRGVPEGGLVLINKKLKHKSVPVQLEKEAVVTVEESAQRSRSAAPAAAGLLSDRTVSTHVTQNFTQAGPTSC